MARNHVCVKCKTFLKPKKNGVVIEEGRPISEPGLGDDGRSKTGWGPYKLYMADLLECRSCGFEMGLLSPGPFTEHYMQGYAETVARMKPLIRVEDC